MINIGSRTGHKLGILVIFTTLAISSAAAVSWKSPSSGEMFDANEITLNVTEDTANYVDFWVKLSEDSSYTHVKNQSSSTNNFYTYSLTQYGDGTYDIRANNSNGQQTQTNVVFDTQEPNLDSNSPTGSTSNSDPEISVEVSDSGNSGVDYTYLNVTDSGDNDVDNTKGTTLDLSDLDDEQYTVNYKIKDNAGNWNNDSWTFTVDTEYDGDSNPSFSVEDESGGVVLFDEDKDLTVDFGDADSESDTTVTCYVGGEDVDSFDVTSDNPDESDTTCTIDEDDNADYYDTDAEIYLEMEDEAGNTAESDSETVSFDVNPPSVTGLEIPTSAELYNSNFDVEFTAFDAASDIQDVEYYFESDTNYGDGNSLDYSVDTDSYEIDTSGLEAGDHTLYVRAKDEAGRWSSARTVDFSFDPDAVPEVSLGIPENFSVTAGEQKDLEVTVENTGELHISSLKVSSSAKGVFADSQSISDLEPGESVTATMEVETNSGNIGEHTIEVSTDNPSITQEVGLVVRANEEQQSQIDSDLSEYQTTLQEMESNVTSLKQKVSADKKQRLDSNFSKFKQKVEDAQAAVEEGDYYEAESILEGIEQDRSAAESTYKAVQKEYKNNQFWMFVILGLGGIVVLGGGGIAAVSYSDEVDFDVRDYLDNLQELEFDTSALEGIPEKIKGMFDSEGHSEAEEFEWEGFNNN